MQLTVKEEWIAISEVQESRKRPYTVSLGEWRILNFHHVNAIDVTFIINVLQFFKNNVTRATVRLVCDEREEDGDVALSKECARHTETLITYRRRRRDN